MRIINLSKPPRIRFLPPRPGKRTGRTGYLPTSDPQLYTPPVHFRRLTEEEVKRRNLRPLANGRYWAECEDRICIVTELR